MTLLRSQNYIHISKIFFEYGFVVGHRFDCSTRLLSPYYSGFDARTNNVYFKFNDIVYNLYTLRNFLVDLSRYRYKFFDSNPSQASLFNIINIFSDRGFSSMFAYIFKTLSTHYGKNNYYGIKKYIDLGTFRFYIIARPIEGFITNCASIHSDLGPLKWKGMPSTINYGKTLFFSYGDYTLHTVVKSAKANIMSSVAGVVNSNQFRTLDYFDYPIVANDQSFKLYTFVSIFFLKTIFKQAYLSF